MKFGYLVPEFPGQTHAFFWREIASMQDFGMEPEIISTRRPNRQMMPQTWARQAESATTYLAPLSMRGGAKAATVLFWAVVRGRGRRLWIGLRPELDRLLREDGGTAARGVLRLLGLLIVGAELAELARRRGWTHVHVHSCADSAQLAVFAHQLSGLKYSLTLHGPLGDYGPNQVMKWQLAEFCTVITKQLHSEITSTLGSEVAARTEVAPMGVDSELFSRQFPYVPWNRVTPARIFSCGRLNPSKGHDDLVRALGQLVVDGYDVELVIAGEDEEGGTGYRRRLERLVDKLGLDGRVTLLGAISEEQVRLHLERAHIFALASHAEPLGVAIMEAMAMELPVVVTAGGGVSELVEDGVSGILVPSASPAEMAEGLRNVLTDPELAMRLGRDCRQGITENFTSQRGAATLSRLIRDHSSAGPYRRTKATR